MGALYCECQTAQAHAGTQLEHTLAPEPLPRKVASPRILHSSRSWSHFLRSTTLHSEEYRSKAQMLTFSTNFPKTIEASHTVVPRSFEFGSCFSLNKCLQIKGRLENSKGRLVRVSRFVR